MLNIKLYLKELQIKKPINELNMTIQDFKLMIKRADINKSKNKKC